MNSKKRSINLIIVTTLVTSFLSFNSIAVTHDEIDDTLPSARVGGPESGNEQKLEDVDWWKTWKAMQKEGGLTEGHNCYSLISIGELSYKQRGILTTQCAEVAFIDTFNNEEGDQYRPLTGAQNISNKEVQLLKWNILGRGITLDDSHSRLIGDIKNTGYVVSLGSTNGPSTIETKGSIEVTKGSYSLLFKLKEKISGSHSFSGVQTKIVGKRHNYAHQNNFVLVEKSNNDWTTIEVPFDVKCGEDSIYISLTDIFSGTPNFNAVIDSIVLFKKN